MCARASYAEPSLRGEIELALSEQNEMTITALATWVDAEIRDVVHQVKKLREEGKVTLRKQWPYGRTIVRWG